MKRFDDLLDTGRAIDTHEAYRDMLRECYSQDLNGPFAHLDPAKILEEMAPTDFRCGHVDYVDSQDWTEYNGEEYKTDYLEKVREECEDMIQEELDSAEDDILELQEELADLEDQKPDDDIVDRIRVIRADLEGLNALVVSLEEELENLKKLF